MERFPSLSVLSIQENLTDDQVSSSSLVYPTFRLLFSSTD
jgi:hypothetical protein